MGKLERQRRLEAMRASDDELLAIAESKSDKAVIIAAQELARRAWGALPPPIVQEGGGGRIPPPTYTPRTLLPWRRSMVDRLWRRIGARNPHKRYAAELYAALEAIGLWMHPHLVDWEQWAVDVGKMPAINAIERLATGIGRRWISNPKWPWPSLAHEGVGLAWWSAIEPRLAPLRRPRVACAVRVGLRLVPDEGVPALPLGAPDDLQDELDLVRWIRATVRKAGAPQEKIASHPSLYVRE